IETAEREGGIRKQIRRPAKADWRTRPNSESFAKSQHRIKASATGNFRTVRTNCTRACRRSNASSAAATEAQETNATQGTRACKHLGNHVVGFGGSSCDVHASPQVSGQGTYGQCYGNWSLFGVGRSGERPRNHSFDGTKYWGFNVR